MNLEKTLSSHRVPESLNWDIFCSVIDNFGDIGVSWRLANLLVHQQGQKVSLWVDDLAALQMLVPATQLDLDEQVLHQVTIRVWQVDKPFRVLTDSVDVTLETFGCALPQPYLDAMDGARVWINLEYLTAESWALECHKLGALQANGLKRYFYFPGFMKGTGGLMQEADYEARRLAFMENKEQQDAFCRAWQLPFNPDLKVFKISLFAYQNEALPELVQQWLAGNKPILVYLPVGPLLQSLNSAFSLDLKAGQVWRCDKLQIAVITFLPQSAYDQLLWLCDLNFVRGEESFVRAQWAAKPFIWHIYPTEDGAHLEKLQAFLDIYPNSTVLQQMMMHWNLKVLAGNDWQNIIENLDCLNHNAQDWIEHLKNLGELSTNLLSFTKTLRKRI